MVVTINLPDFKNDKCRANKPCCQKYANFRQEFVSLVEGFSRLVGGNPRELSFLYEKLRQRFGLDTIVYVMRNYGCPICNYPSAIDIRADDEKAE